MAPISGQTSTPSGVQGFLASVWPLVLPTDSELLRRKKRTIRAAQLAVVVMVVAAVLGSVVAGVGQFSALRIMGLALVGLCYLGWSLYGMREAVRAILGEPDAPAPAWPPGAPWHNGFYFAVQLVLAGLVCYLSGLGHERMLAWLVLLPPVAHSVILLRPLGIALVSLLIIGILAWNVALWHGWQLVPNALLAFSFALLFTLVFTQLAVGSEKARWEVQHLASELADANRKLRAYAVQAEELAATRERNQLAREIHDSLGHYLTVVNVQIEAARAVGERHPDRARDALDKAQSLTQEGLREIRNSVAALRASPLDGRSLVEALGQIIEENRTAGLPTELQILGDARALSPPAGLTLYRALQETLTNARKHSRATAVHVALDFQEPAVVRLTVGDNGVGTTDAAVAKNGFGLLGLRERAQLLGGAIRIQTAAGRGFSVEVEVPG